MDAAPARNGVSGRRSAALLLAALLCADAGHGQEEDQGICPPRLLTFRSLKHGEFDYCRMHLRYRPGTYDCLRIVAPTCNFVVDGRRRPGLTLGSGSELFGTAERIVCPPGPPAPSCPAGYPDAPIPRP
jgi:hypothetical protein